MLNIIQMTKLKKKAVKAVKNSTNNILILGSGLTGKAVADFYQEFYPDYNIIIYDSRDINNNILSGKRGYEKLKNLNNDILKNIHQIILSPGIHPRNILINNLISFLKTKNSKIKVISELDLFITHAKAPIIAITGTNGKSTVCKLVHDILLSCNKKSLLGGNFGPPSISLLNHDIPIPDYYVIEISSFQLSQTYNFKAYIGCILNISHDHLDYHGSYEEYKKCKYKILENTEHFITPEMISSTKFNEEKNLNNLAALKIADILHLDPKNYLSILKNAKKLPHRYQIINNKIINKKIKNKKIIWINDSKATNIAATIYALKQSLFYCQNKVILILGGETKGQNFNLLLDFIYKNKNLIRSVCLVGVLSNQEHLKRAIISIEKINIKIYLSNSLLDACEICKKIAQKNDIVLLSPACSSLDEYKSYEKRGDMFIKSVSEIYK